MSKYYNAKRKSNLYKPGKRFPLSRSKIDLFMDCPRCFYLDRKLGVKRPPMYPYTLNSAVDKLLKKEFDIKRANGEKHPLIKEYGVDAIPVKDDNMGNYRNNFKGIRFFHKDTNLEIFGAIDDLWKNSKGEYIVVDYKSTSKNENITKLDKDWQDSYKRQMEVYQWLLKKNGYNVSDTGYFVYCNGITDKKAFDGKLEFDITLIDYKGDTSWVEPKIKEIYNCLNLEKIPESSKDCDYCAYRREAKKVIKENKSNSQKQNKLNF